MFNVLRFLSLFGLGLAMSQAIGYITRFFPTGYLWLILISILFLAMSQLFLKFVPASRITVHTLIIIWFGGLLLSLI